MIRPVRSQTLMLVAVLLAATGACNRQASQVERDASVPAPERATDTSIETSVKAQLYADDSIRGTDIDVSAGDGVVTLRGAVSSDAARQQAVTIARGVAGVTRVDDQLRLEQAQATAASPEPSPYRAAGANNAAWITTKIQAQYFVHPDIKPWNVDVTTSSAGVVELRGDVESAQAKSEAVRIARATEGVTGVEDHLRVRTDASDVGEVEVAADGLSDAWLTAKVQAKYFLDDDIKALDIDVSTQDRVVTLSGTVDSELERRQAVAMARNTDGVQSVRDQLRLDRGAASSEARGTTGTEVVAGVEDAWVTTKIQSRYFLDPDVKGHKIDVDTRNGVVTLAGSVASESRKDLAEQIARETDGATRVVNRLTVTAER
jgi:hyperosmotically inducible periplasmic protein